VVIERGEISFFFYNKVIGKEKDGKRLQKKGKRATGQSFFSAGDIVPIRKSAL